MKNSPFSPASAVREALAAACKAAGSQKEWAAQNGVSGAFVSDVLAGRREPGSSILRALGFERVTLYRRTSN